MNEKRVLILKGGSWHDGDGFANAMTALLTPLGWTVLSTYDMDQLLRLEGNKIDLLISYTCFSANPDPEHQKGSVYLTDEQVDALAEWVRAGGKFLPAHAATAAGKTKALYSELIGGKFIEHPPQFSFTVSPMYAPHPITEGIEAFTVLDEFYIETYSPEVNVHMVALDRGVAHPMVWSKAEGKGRVAHVAPGHGPNVWQMPQYQQLMLNTIGWLMEG
ncbi:MAG: ThuA domain-containing protein [Anaerolineaceae bacterium]|nr:ThuA domain-containing protein [Anaerolineaceae bacterium]